MRAQNGFWVTKRKWDYYFRSILSINFLSQNTKHFLRFFLLFFNFILFFEVNIQNYEKKTLNDKQFQLKISNLVAQIDKLHNYHVYDPVHIVPENLIMLTPNPYHHHY